MYINNSKYFYQKSQLLTNFLNSNYDGMFYIGHASILVRLNNKKFIFDAIEQTNFYNNSWCFFPSQLMDKRLLDIDGAFVSHIHQDHYDPSFLRKLQKKKVPIYILNGRKHFKKVLNDEKINFNLIPHNKKFFIDKNIWIYGALHEYNDVDSSMLISNNRLSVYHGNDNFITEKTLNNFKKSVGEVDVGCIPFAFIHYYPYLLDKISKKEIKREGKRLEDQFMDYGITQSKLLKPKIVIPFGSNLFHADDADSLMNKAVATPVDFVSYAKKKHNSNLTTYKTMLSGSYCLKNNGTITTYYENVTTKKFNLELKKFINNNRKNKIYISSKKQIKTKRIHFLNIQKKISQNPDRVKHKIIIGSKNSIKDKICINLYTNKVTIFNKQTLPNNCHYFKLEVNEYNKWLSGKLTFEEVLGSRRFTYIRKPNNYSVKVMQIYTNYL
jgi:metal-dependent hydrolase (beta-lactamase superfamily II)